MLLRLTCLRIVQKKKNLMRDSSDACAFDLWNLGQIVLIGVYDGTLSPKLYCVFFQQQPSQRSNWCQHGWSDMRPEISELLTCRRSPPRPCYSPFTPF